MSTSFDYKYDFLETFRLDCTYEYDYEYDFSSRLLDLTTSTTS